MKTNYKEYPRKYIGDSDSAYLVVDSCNGLFKLHFGKDAGYRAYIVDENAEIGSHYEKVASCGSWLRIYDGFGQTVIANGEEINIYRAGEMGCVIEIINGNYGGI